MLVLPCLVFPTFSLFSVVLQVVVQYETEQLDMVLDCLERTTAHLTAAIVSKDTQFQNKVRHYPIRAVHHNCFCGAPHFLVYLLSL